MNPKGGLHVPGLKSVEVESVNHINEVSDFATSLYFLNVILLVLKPDYCQDNQVDTMAVDAALAPFVVHQDISGNGIGYNELGTPYLKQEILPLLAQSQCWGII